MIEGLIIVLTLPAAFFILLGALACITERES